MALVIEIKVIPNARKQACILDASGRLKCYLKSAPEQGKANKELIKYLAHMLQCSASSIILIAGATSRIKKISIDYDITYEQLLRRLGLEKQEQMSLLK